MDGPGGLRITLDVAEPDARINAARGILATLSVA